MVMGVCTCFFSFLHLCCGRISICSKSSVLKNFVGRYVGVGRGDRGRVCGGTGGRVCVCVFVPVCIIFIGRCVGVCRSVCRSAREG